MRHFQVDAHIYSKREVKRIARKTGKSRSEVVGAMVCLWGHIAVHSRDTGTIDGDYEDLADELDQDAEFWQAVQSEGWLTCDPQAVTVTVPDWQSRFYTGTPSERGKKYRESKAQMENERSASARRTETNTHEHIDRIDNRIKDKRIKEERIEEPAPAGDLSSVLFNFKKNLQAAGVATGNIPPEVMNALQNGEAATYLRASRELSHTALMERPSPPHIGNFKKLDWVQRLANGEFSKGGPAPQEEPEDPMDRWVTVHAAGKRMTRRDAIAWTQDPANAEYIEAYKNRGKRNLDRDNHRVDAPSADAPIPQAITPPVLKNADEDFDTEKAKEQALAALAAYIEK